MLAQATEEELVDLAGIVSCFLSRCWDCMGFDYFKLRQMLAGFRNLNPARAGFGQNLFWITEQYV